MEKLYPRILLGLALLGFNFALFGRIFPQASQGDELLSAIAALGYKVLAEPTPSPCWKKFEQDKYNLKAKRELLIKSIKPVSRVSGTFVRFQVWEETYDDEGSAETRLLSIHVTPVCAPVEQREFWMAFGFRIGTTAYILSTDAVLFEGEMSRWAKQLEGRLKRRGQRP